MNLQPLLDALSEGEAPSLEGLDRSDWEQLARAIRLGAFDRAALVGLLRQAAGNRDAVPVISELTADLGVPLAVSRALLTEDSVAQLEVLLQDSGFAAVWEQQGPPERLVVPLARLLADSRSWVWLARGLFHSSVVSTVPQLVRDDDAEVRLAATEALAQTEGDEATEALFTLLSDTDDRIRQAAHEALEPRCEEPALAQRLEEESEELDTLVARADSSLIERVPGLSGLFSALRRQQTDRRPGIDPKRRTVLDKLRARFRLYSGQEDATATVVLGVAMAWADGAIHDDERAALQKLVEQHLDNDPDREAISVLIEDRPSPAALAPWLGRLNDPGRVARALREDFDLDEDARTWLSEVATAAGFDERVFEA